MLTVPTGSNEVDIVAFASIYFRVSRSVLGFVIKKHRLLIGGVKFLVHAVSLKDTPYVIARFSVSNHLYEQVRVITSQILPNGGIARPGVGPGHRVHYRRLQFQDGRRAIPHVGAGCL